MSGAVAFVRTVVCLAGTLTHHAVSNDKRRAVLLLLGILDGFANLVNVVSVNFLYIPAPSLILLGCILCGDNLGLGRELDVVGIVEHNQVIESQVTGNTACTL